MLVAHVVALISSLFGYVYVTNKITLHDLIKHVTETKSSRLGYQVVSARLKSQLYTVERVIVPEH